MVLIHMVLLYVHTSMQRFFFFLKEFLLLFNKVALNWLKVTKIICKIINVFII